MAQRALLYEYETEEGKGEMTWLGGLPMYLDFAASVGAQTSIDRHMKMQTGDHGWPGRQMIVGRLP